MSYLAALVPLAAGAFVELDGVVVPESLQPVSSAPTTKPNSTIRVYVLFIGKGKLS